jgi:hypothetical protein
VTRLWQYDRAERRWSAIIGSPTDCGMTCPTRLETRDARWWTDTEGMPWGWRVLLDDGGDHIEVRSGLARTSKEARVIARSAGREVERIQREHAIRWDEPGYIVDYSQDLP